MKKVVDFVTNVADGYVFCAGLLIGTLIKVFVV